MVQPTIFALTFLLISSVYCQIGQLNTNPDGSQNLNLRVPIAGNDKNMLSALGSISGAQNGHYGAAGAGLALDNVNGHGLSVTGSHIPNVADQLSANARLNLINTDNHKLNANAFLTHTMPKNSPIPDFNTHGGSVNYMFKDKIGGSLGVAQTPLFQKTDYSAMGNLNLFKTPTSSLDFSAGMTKSVSPYIPNHNWQPAGGLSYTRYWG